MQGSEQRLFVDCDFSSSPPVAEALATLGMCIRTTALLLVWLVEVYSAHAHIKLTATVDDLDRPPPSRDCTPRSRLPSPKAAARAVPHASANTTYP